MGYSASWGGCLRIRNLFDDAVMDELQDVFENCHIDTNKMQLELYGDGKYHEDDVYNILTKIEKDVISGEIEFSGEDESHWRFIFTDGHWKEEGGAIYYESEIDNIKIKTAEIDKEEFIGCIIDIIQDVLDDPQGDTIEGEWYNKIQQELTDTMKAWNVFR